MLKMNLRKIPLLKSIWPTLGNIRDWFIKTSKEKSMSLILLIYRKIGKFIEELILVQQIPQRVSGLQLIETRTGTYQVNITLQEKQLTITLVSSTPINYQEELLELMVTLLGPSGLVSLAKGEFILPQPIRKPDSHLKDGSDSELKRLQRNLKVSQAIPCPYCKNSWTKLIGGTLCPSCLSSIPVSIRSRNLKPTVGKKRVSRKRKI